MSQKRTITVHFIVPGVTQEWSASALDFSSDNLNDSFGYKFEEDRLKVFKGSETTIFPVARVIYVSMNL